MSIYRLYSFTNYYLSSLQKGLQTAHVVSEMAFRNSIFRERFPDSPESAFEQWSRKDRTIIILNGGNSAQLQALNLDLQKLSLNENPCFFREDEESLGRAFTAVGILLPDEYWDPKHPKRDNEEVVVVRKFLDKFSLAV